MVQSATRAQDMGPSNDPAAANLVWARRPDDSAQFMRLRVDPEVVRQFVDDGRNAGLGQYCGLIHGAIKDGFPSLVRANALFRGIQRPMIDFDHDGQVLVYVANPPHTFEYPAVNRFNDRDPAPGAKPKNAVFVVYVRLIKEGAGWTESDDVSGEILNWEWVLGHAPDYRLPEDYDTRYTEKVWER
jgi:hypothetical protein